MNVRLVLRVVLLLALALVVALVLRGIFAGAAAPPPPPKTALAVASARLAEGTLIKADDLTWREVLESEVKKGDVTRAEAERLNGAVVRHGVDEGVVITQRDVVFPDAPGFLAAALQPGMRAVSVAIDDVSGNAGLTLPGDRVDLILTHNLGSGGDMRSGPPRVASETVLAAVRVIAVGQALRAPEPDSAAAKAGGGAARTVTLEVTPRDAESVTVASRLGQLSLALCSLAQPRAAQGEGAAEPSAPVWGKDISQVVRMTGDEGPAEAPMPAMAPSRPQVQVFRGSGGN